MITEDKMVKLDDVLEWLNKIAADKMNSAMGYDTWDDESSGAANAYYNEAEGFASIVSDLKAYFEAQVEKDLRDKENTARSTLATVLAFDLMRGGDAVGVVAANRMATKVVAALQGDTVVGVLIHNYGWAWDANSKAWDKPAPLPKSALNIEREPVETVRVTIVRD